MALTETQKQFIRENPSAAMITVGDDEYPKAVRVGVTIVGDRLWSSGTRDRVRTTRLRSDPRCTLFVFGPGHEALTIETTVDIIEGSEAVAKSVDLFRTMQDRPHGPLMWFGDEMDEESFRRAMVDQRRLIYDFTVVNAYGV